MIIKHKLTESIIMLKIRLILRALFYLSTSDDDDLILIDSAS